MAPNAGQHAMALTTALVQELAAAMGAMVGASATATPSTTAIDVTWGVSVTVGAPTAGAVTVGFTREDCARFCALVLGDEDEPADSAVIDLLQELLGQAVGAVRETPAGKGLLFCVETPGRLVPPAEAPQFFTVSLAPDFTPVVAVWALFESTAAAAVPSPASELTPPPARSAAESSAAQRVAASAPTMPANLDVILDIDLPLSVRFGQTDLTLEALTRLGPGSVIDLGRSPDDVVDVLVNGRLVARGEVVVVAGNYGVRIVEVVSAADRVRSMGR
jgi:flagellar motor switch protein FliN